MRDATNGSRRLQVCGDTNSCTSMVIGRYRIANILCSFCLQLKNYSFNFHFCCYYSQSFQYVCQHDGCSKSFQEISKLQRHQLVCGVKRVMIFFLLHKLFIHLFLFRLSIENTYVPIVRKALPRIGIYCDTKWCTTGPPNWYLHLRNFMVKQQLLKFLVCILDGLQKEHLSARGMQQKFFGCFKFAATPFNAFQ